MPAIQPAVAYREAPVYRGHMTRQPPPSDTMQMADMPGESQESRHRRWVAAIADARDKDAFAALFEHFAPRIKAYVMRIGADPASAEELAQEAMISVWRKAGTFDPAKAAVSTWIFAIARNRRIDQVRREKRPTVDESELAGGVEWQEDAFGDVQAAEEHVILGKAISTLPPEQAEVIRKAFYEDKSHGVVAEELGLPLGTVKSRIRLALTHLRRQVSETLS